VSIEHLRVLAPVAADPGAVELLHEAAGHNPDGLRQVVARFELTHHPRTLAEQQHESRYVRFSPAAHGCVGVRAVLPPLEGEELRNRLTRAADAAWRNAHPERAETLGGHDTEP
jgi:hypothetical protein